MKAKPALLASSNRLGKIRYLLSSDQSQEDLKKNLILKSIFKINPLEGGPNFRHFRHFF